MKKRRIAVWVVVLTLVCSMSCFGEEEDFPRVFSACDDSNIELQSE